MKKSRAFNISMGKRGAYSISRKTSLYGTRRPGQVSMVVAGWNPGKFSSSSPFPGQHKVRIPYVNKTKVQPQWVDKLPCSRTPYPGLWGQVFLVAGLVNVA